VQALQRDLSVDQNPPAHAITITNLQLPTSTYTAGSNDVSHGATFTDGTATASKASPNSNCFGDLSRLAPLPSLRLVAEAGRAPVPFDSVKPGSTDAGQCIERDGVVRCLPHIVGIGAQKAGTGELMQYAHFTPQIKASRCASPGMQ